ncbi:hypothetical protein BN3087_820022 [Sulfurovum sp. enrichment culture clone C5]|uniref:Uncharacterized protein n=1 Tax=Sulfurovum sp. enrichment culture clone C5 TaxID=497650 RepID=A0A0S4XRJ6_9BACT|nr:hypothetical protein BN3087_820022 [Sulfurovum sp. enrichment culture clone C5]
MYLYPVTNFKNVISLLNKIEINIKIEIKNALIA